MTSDIALWLVQDGIVNGAIYALVALALLLVFAVTRVIFVPQGEFISYAALSMAMLQLGQVPATIWILVGGGLVAAILEAVTAWRQGAVRRLPSILARYIAIPIAIAALVGWSASHALPSWVQALLVLALIMPLGPILYRIAYQPLANASVIVLFIVSMAVHYMLTGLGLVFFGAEGLRADPFIDAGFQLGILDISAQSLIVIAVSILMMICLWLFFERSLYGKALRATAINRTGARLVGIRIELSGNLSFLLAAFIGAVSGVLISPITTIYYDSGLMIGLKGFIGAIFGGMASYPLTALGAVGLGLLESFSSFWASALKESIVFTIIIPILIWRSLTSHQHIEDEEE